MAEACRTCLRLIDVDNLPFYEIEADDVGLSTESCRYKLLSLIPEMALNITLKSVICGECHGSLEAMFEFKAKCLETEKIIAQYFQAKPDEDSRNLDLKDVSAFNKNHAGDFKNTEVEFVAVKEEMESSNLAVDGSSMHEDNSRERAKVVQPVPEESESGRLTCRVCSKTFIWRSRLKQHMFIHTNERPYKCTVCSKGFNDKSGLNNHVKIHTEVKEFECEVCGKRFRHLSTFKNHTMMHMAVRKYVCVYCDKSFINGYRLKVHMHSHTDDKPFACEICEQRFAQKVHLTNHMRKHAAERPYI